MRKLMPLLVVSLLSPALAPAAPLFVEETARLGSPQPCAGGGGNEGCYSNYVVLADLDGDDDLDAVFASGGGYYAPATTAPMAVYLNDGAGQLSEINASAFGGFAGRLRQVAVGDIDGDGDLDVIAPDSWAMQADAVFVNDGASPPGFADEGATRLGTSSRAGAARLGDLDGDGDLDLVLTDWGANPPDSAGTARVYDNDGSGQFTEVVGAVPMETSGIGTGPIDVDLFDADGDLDLDLVVASRVGESLLFVNDGDGGFTDANARFPDQPGPYVYGPDPCDVDGDGDLDVWLDNGGPQRREQLLINDGSGSFADESAARITGNSTADDNEVQCADLDGDGDLDAVVASLSGEERLLVNDGAGVFTAVGDAFPAVGDATLGLDFGDLDGDGRLDAITAQGELGAFLNRVYIGTAAQPADTQAPRFRALASAVGPRGALRFAVVDAATSDVGPRLREAHVEIEGGGGAQLAARFAGGDLYQVMAAQLPVGAFSYRACATDWAGNQACSDPVAVVVTMPTVDAGPGGSVDAGPGGGDGDGDGGGCGCRAGGASAGGPISALLLLLLCTLGLWFSRNH